MATASFLPQPANHPSLMPTGAALGALGVVYGDIGTSPLYALKEAVKAASAGSVPAAASVLGVVSLIIWSLILIVSLKYATLILRAHNRGEGGIVAMLALLHARHAEPGTWRAGVLMLGLLGAALLYGDGVITPAISVLSAIEGLKVDAPQLAPVVMPLTVAVLVCLFAVQRRGTGFIGGIFGPIMLTWFGVIGVLGVMGIVAAPRILRRSIHSTRLDFSCMRQQWWPSRFSAQLFWRSQAGRPCTPIWDTSAAGRSGSRGLRWCCRHSF